MGQERVGLWAMNLTQPSVWAVRMYRIAHVLWMRRWRWLALAITCAARIVSGIEIHPQATIGRRFAISHGFGVVIGETAEIGDDCLILQGVTLGGRHPAHPRWHPKLGNGVRVGAGAVILGPVTIGDGAQIGANAVVLHDIPAGLTAVGVPARVVGSSE